MIGVIGSCFKRYIKLIQNLILSYSDLEHFIQYLLFLEKLSIHNFKVGIDPKTRYNVNPIKHYYSTNLTHFTPDDTEKFFTNI